jgi:hypothetical protein
MDDEYFRLMLSVREDIYPHPVVQETLPKIIRSLSRPKASEFARGFVRRVRLCEAMTPGGVHLGVRPVYDFDPGRLERTVARIAKGLFFVERGHRLPTDFKMLAFCLDAIGRVDPKNMTLLSKLSTRPIKVIAEEVFAYSWGSVAEDPDTTGWLLTFYNQTSFVCLTWPNCLGHSKHPAY